jgi:hypothetical protein
MSRSPLRKDKTCLNCNYVVENRFCPNCGQENTDTRKTFHHLFIHFFEDLTHYENAFWKTIKNLLLKPASLTKQYLSGKRLSYLAPVRLYIFISFVTFLCFSVFSESSDSIKEKTLTKKEVDSLVYHNPKKDFMSKILGLEYKNIKELDDFQKKATPKNKLSSFEYNITKRLIDIKEKNSNDEIIEKFKESFKHNIPKLLFLYMPFFAFLLWLFHNKRKWYYFDHGIFTLHYFSFLLLVLLVVFLLNKFIDYFFDSTIIDCLATLVSKLSIFWMIYYFFPAHHRFYEGSRLKSIIYGLLLLFINFIFMAFVMTIYIFYTFLSIH